jgi:hypothetical protein
MGLTKQYVRYVASSVFSVVGSQKSNIVYLELQGIQGKYCAVGACENVVVWDLRSGDKVSGPSIGGRHYILTSYNRRHCRLINVDDVILLFHWFCHID